MYDRFPPAAFRLAVRILRDHRLAEGAVAEGFISVWRTAARFDAERSAVGSWILMLVHRRAVDLVRSNQRYCEQTGEPAGFVPSAADVADLNSERRPVQIALAALPVKQREALELAYYGGYTQQEIATRLGLPIGTIKSQTFSGLHRLRQLLQPPEHPRFAAGWGRADDSLEADVLCAASGSA